MCHEHLTAPIRGGAGIVEERVEVPGADRAIPAYLARPEEGSAPGVLIIHDVWGANPFYHDVARRLAGEGFAVLLPDFFVREGALEEQTRDAAMARRARHDQTKAVADVAGALGWLREHPAATGKVGTLGFCMGGTLVFLAAAREPLPDASVAFYGFPVPKTTELAPLVPLDEAERVRSPLLALWGDQDQGVGMENVERYRDALMRAGAQHEFVVYPGPGHGFLTFDPTAPSFVEAQDAWGRTVAFLRTTLTPGPSPAPLDRGAS
ncbi:MAG: carboxymethylenebutenolidase [Thermomicrobiales bacterium]|jgi:carboxymethylenebutenolidase|nr:carboxymethylenebutenolidase [Thermomicrobiales bacterium]